MKYLKNKKAIAIYYLSVFVIFAALLAVIPLVLFERTDAVRIVLLCEAALIGVSVSMIRMIKGEMNQSVELCEKTIKCNDFIIRGTLANAEIDYASIESIKMKSIPFMPGSYCIWLCIPNDTPAVINDKFINYKEMWLQICENCKNSNPNVKIDSKIYKRINAEK